MGGKIVNAGGRFFYQKDPVDPSATPPSDVPPPIAAVAATVPPPPPRPVWYVEPPPPFEIPASLLYKIDRYTHERAGSERLVQAVRGKNPDKSGKWCAEKALWDLERDRK
ncbi:hypothetical protein [Pseudanabaena sp. FACHB-2040]|uniref:hypothetical protein n=1 Tax=Pseudanabaena sp. FACHB-2040 TaxID=2692859 RepID=UPI00168909FE|nr:hypothetical protein [Pseudanabaena sp. FACHB-2040]MBD2259907.1 hypothetical protein [Pseudanabaena sp. FACHB-2040]